MRLLKVILLSLSFLYANPYNDIVNYKLDNGMNIYLLPNKESKNIYVEAVVNVGMRAENKNNAGISHLLEHLIFRDKRVKNSDYYDVINEAGATYVNGFTGDYTTTYLAKIDAKKAYWIVETFYKMLFDKNLTQEDLDVERKALQIEIGEPNWTDKISFKFFTKIGDFLEKISAPTDYQLYRDDFKIDLKKDEWERFSQDIYKKNNKKFTLEDILKYYTQYYYPSNITLKIVGNFDIEKMKKLIENSFGKMPKREGKKLIKPIYKDAKLSHKAYIKNGMSGFLPAPNVSMGYKFIDDNITKKIVLDSYFKYLAQRVNRILRNKRGESYSVFGYANSFHNAGLGYISFNTSHNKFEKNINQVQDWLKRESKGNISDEIIKKSIANEKKKYESIDSDVESLMDVVDDIIYKKRFYQDGYKNPYSVLNSISNKEFKDIIKENFKDSNFYFIKTKDYSFFPYDGMVLSFLTFIAFIYILVRLNKKGIKKKDIRLKVPIGNIFIYFLSFIIAFFVAGIIGDWIEYFIVKLTYPKLLKIDFLGNKWDYLIFILEFILFVVVFILISKLLFGWFYRKVVIANGKLYLMGHKLKEIDLNSIKNIEVVPWSFDKILKIYGFFLRFWKRVLKIKTDNGEIYYIRYKNPEELKNLIEKFRT